LGNYLLLGATEILSKISLVVVGHESLSASLSSSEDSDFEDFIFCDDSSDTNIPGVAKLSDEEYLQLKFVMLHRFGIGKALMKQILWFIHQDDIAHTLPKSWTTLLKREKEIKKKLLCVTPDKVIIEYINEYGQMKSEAIAFFRIKKRLRQVFEVPALLHYLHEGWHKWQHCEQPVVINDNMG